MPSYKLISDQITLEEMTVIIRELQRVLDRQVPGDVVELGCYEGTSALIEARVIHQQAPHKRLWLYDSFEGLPSKSSADESPAGVQFTAGTLRASKQTLIRHFRKAGLPMPHITKAWFADLTPDNLPDQICFAFLDGDFFESIRQSLYLVWSKLTPGAIVIVDDYRNEALPGTAAAVDKWLKTHHAHLQTEASLAIIKPIH